ncbi:hypothetical protein JD844_033747 [Phrynosoma platyrhinos]|uniref:X-ray radiation resistance associated 1 n=1 Tax=Phrynosoma platyrhinos TaxID=52577 RepID=A0ABQ7T6R4_PHRPL|nr:hypothetical protein JD844_033747 [Phrynosoma platyrhinos]
MRVTCGKVRVKIKQERCHNIPKPCPQDMTLASPSYATRKKVSKGAGHWHVARQTAEQAKIELLLGRRPTRIKWKQEVVPKGNLRHLDEKTLDAVQLIQLHHVKSPSDLCSVNVSNQNFSSLPYEGCQRFPALEVLLLDDNHLSHPNVFVSLANLQNLKQLNLDRNGIKEVPYLHHVGNSCFSIHPLSAKSGIREGLRSRRNAGKRLRDGPPKRSETPEYIILQNSKDPDRTEVVFPFWTPEPSTQIEHEEDLLAVALFPSLTELTFYGNPFTTSRSGDPPLLTSFLQNKLGIKLVRKKISKLEKPRLFIPVKANRKVKSQLPKVRKHPPKLDSLIETTFWQLWTGADLDPNKLSLGLSQPLPSIKSLVYDPNQPILLTLAPEERSAPYSLTSSFTEEDLSAFQSSISQLPFGSVSEPFSSLDQFLFAPISEAQSSPEQGQSQPLSPHRLLLEKRDPTVLAARLEKLLTEEDLGDLLPGEDQAESGPPSGIPSTEKDVSEGTPSTLLAPLARQDQVEPTLPPLLPPQEQDLSEPVPTSWPCMAEGALSGTPPPVTCEEEQLPPVPPPNSPLPAESLLKPVPSMEPPAEEQDMSKSPPPVIMEEDLPKAFPPTGLPMLEDDQLESIPPASSSLQGLDWLESVSPSGSLTGDLSGVLLPGASPIGDDQIELAPSQSLLSPAQDLLEPDSLINVPTVEPDVAKLLPPAGLPLEEKDQSESVLSPSLFLEEQNFSEPVPFSGSLGGEEDLVVSLPPAVEHAISKEQDLPELLNPNQEPEPQMSRTSVSQAEDFQPFEPSQQQKISSDFLLASRSSSRELYQLFAQAHMEAMPIGLSDEFPSETLSISDEFLGEKKPEPFFMTQVDEVPRIQHNVQALERALRYPRVYRESKARLDSFQKPYVSTPKKVLRVPARKAQKTKAEMLEEILLEMRNPTNITHVPLDNWREYRKALELLKEFQKDYKETVAACNQVEKTKSVSKKYVGAEVMDQNQILRSLPEVRVSKPRVQEPQAKDEQCSVSTEEPSVLEN